MGLTALYITICRKHDDHFVNPYIAAVLLPDQELSVCRSESGYLCVLHVDATDSMFGSCAESIQQHTRPFIHFPSVSVESATRRSEERCPAPSEYLEVQ
jgi:hypothetical protein